MLDDKSLDKINAIFGTHYYRGWAKKNIRVDRDYKGFRFWDRLMRGKPGFNKRKEES
jgi:hypothetical protein